VTLEGFKSYATRVTVPFAPLTVLLGRNNGGKSSIIQSLLLLKQTLADPRSEVPIRLEGDVSALSLRELTWGWPAAGPGVRGPVFEISWESTIDVEAAQRAAGQPNLKYLSKHAGIFVEGWPTSGTLYRSVLRIVTAEWSGTTVIEQIRLTSPGCPGEPSLEIWNTVGSALCFWRDEPAEAIDVEYDHFIPYLHIDRRQVGSRDRQRAWYNAYLFLWAQPLESLKRILGDLQYLGSTRTPPPGLYPPVTVAPREMGISGEYAAQILHRRQRDVVRYLPALDLVNGTVVIPETVRARGLVDAVNEVLESLSIRAPLRVDEIREVGFRLLFGQASLQHVGRGLTYLLPFLELGLLADPYRSQDQPSDLPRVMYQAECGAYAHIAVEEPEAHLHPKVESRLAHWMVSLAMSNRQILVETHSDHLVRRLRGLVARAGAGSELERWLLANVLILEVAQDAEGRSTVQESHLTAGGRIGEHWPEDFMDESSQEDSAIFYAALDKRPVEDADVPIFLHDDGPEPEPLQ